jgi:16S rRNA (uracil1498-N3)-methyltransferase
MRQFVLPADWEEGPRCRLEGERAHYLVRVLRLVTGDRFAALDGRGQRRDCELLEAGPGAVLLAVGPARAAPRPGAELLPDAHGGKAGRPATAGMGAPDGPDAPAEKGSGGSPERGGRAAWPRITLIQSLSKGPAMDLVLRQAAEAGVERVIPFAAERSVVRLSGGRAAEGDRRRERGQRIVREALQQSGSPIATRVEEAATLPDLAALLGPRGSGSQRLILHEAPLAETALHEYLGGALEEIVLCVGPEGGFTDAEIAAFAALGFAPLRLPGAVLRTETAALYAVAAVEILLAERSSWIPSA